MDSLDSKSFSMCVSFSLILCSFVSFSLLIAVSALEEDIGSGDIDFGVSIGSFSAASWETVELAWSVLSRDSLSSIL